MNGMLFTLSMAVLLHSLCLPRGAFAKASTVKITIAGGGLTKSIQVTDPKILDISSAWGDGFLDISRPPADEAPKARQSYEVSLYSEVNNNDVRKTSVVYYYPSSATEPGLVYLPSLNMGTIIRRGRDGRWSYASPAWDALMKRTIAQALDATAPPDALEEAGKVAFDGWTKPERGWLYVLDPQSEADRPGSRVWLFNPQQEKVMGSVRAGYQPDMMLSADGTRLYVASGERESGELAVINTALGTIQHIAFPQRVLYAPWYASLPPFTSMALSSDGDALWILEQSAPSPENLESQVFTFDTRNARFLPTTIALGNCSDGKFVPSASTSQLDVLCSWTNTLHSFRLNAEFDETSSSIVKLPGARHCPVSAGFLLADNRTLALIGFDGAIHEMDTSTKELKSTAVTGECSLATSTPVYPLEWPRSPDGAKVYIGYGPSTPNNLAKSSTVRVFDTAKWQQLGSVQTSLPFWSAAASRDGKLLYALVPEQHNILVLDATTLQEKRRLSVGKLPALAFVSP